MIAQIEQKVVNRLRQVTAAIQQDGTNRVNIIRSAADREAAIEFAKAGAMRPRIVGGAIARSPSDPTCATPSSTCSRCSSSPGPRAWSVQVIPKGADVLAQMWAVTGVRR